MNFQLSRLRLPIYPVMLCLLLSTSLVMCLLLPPSWDVAWRLEIGERILHNALLYRDIVEVNPPLWFWSVLPSNFIAKSFGLPPYAALCVFVHLSALIALWVLDKSLALTLTKHERNWLVISALIATLLLPSGDLGQREVPVLIAGVLWGALAAARIKAVSVPHWLVIGIVLFAAYGFALKHYYLVIPIGLEIWIALKLRHAWRPLRFENVMLAAAGLIYAAAVLQLAPNFLTDIVPLVSLSYADVKAGSLSPPSLHFLYLGLQTLLIISPFYLARSFLKTNVIGQVLLITIGLHVLAIIVQGKGFSNHFLAAKGAAIILWGYICGVTLNAATKVTVSPRVIFGILAVGWIFLPVTLALRPLVLPLASALNTNSTVAQNPVETVINAVTLEPETSRVYVVSTNAGLSFYLPWSQGRAHFSKYYALWMLPGLLTSQLTAHTREAATDQLNIVLASTVAEIKCAAPHLLIGDTSSFGRTLPTGFQTYDVKPMDMLMTQGTFSSWLVTNYTELESHHRDVTIWRANAINGPIPEGC